MNIRVVLVAGEQSQTDSGVVSLDRMPGFNDISIRTVEQWQLNTIYESSDQ